MKQIDFQLRRILQVEIAGEKSEAELVIGGLFQEKPEGPWRCRCSLPGVISDNAAIYGEDEIDALVNCLFFCEMELKGFSNANKRAWWLEPEDRGGVLLTHLNSYLKKLSA